jgi:hypothetical protein
MQQPSPQFHILIEKLEGGRIATRAEMMAALSGRHIDCRQRHTTSWRRLPGRLICFGPRQAKQQTFVLLDEWAPQNRKMERDEALAELARRYLFQPRAGQLAITWWSGCQRRARKALEMVKWNSSRKPPTVRSIGLRRSTRYHRRTWPPHLLPAFDEYFIRYTHLQRHHLAII